MSQQDFDTIVQTLERLTSGEKLALIEQIARSLQASSALELDVAQRQREALTRLRAKVKARPIQNPDDGFSNRDHDRLLYGAL
jgi:hypothetical protein